MNRVYTRTFLEEPFVGCLVLTAELSEAVLEVVVPSAIVGVGRSAVYALTVPGVAVKAAW